MRSVCKRLNIRHSLQFSNLMQDVVDVIQFMKFIIVSAMSIKSDGMCTYKCI